MLGYTFDGMAIAYNKRCHHFVIALEVFSRDALYKFTFYITFTLHYIAFSERELTFTFAMSSSVRLYRSCALLRRLKLSAVFLHHLVC